MFGQMGREVKGLNPGSATEEQLKEIQDLLYKVHFYSHLALIWCIDAVVCSMTSCSSAMYL